MSQDAIPTFDPYEQACFVRRQLIEAMTEQLDGCFTVQGKLVIPVATAECWRLMFDGVIAGLKSLRDQAADNAQLRGMARELARNL